MFGILPDSGLQMTYSYDPVHNQLVVGRSVENIVSLFAPSDCFLNFFPSIEN